MAPTTRRLPAGVTWPSAHAKINTLEFHSAIGQHVLEKDERAANYNEDQFSILDTAYTLPP